MLVALETQVKTVRDTRGAPEVAEQAAATMQAVWPRFLTYLETVREMVQTNAVPWSGSCLSAEAPPSV